MQAQDMLDTPANAGITYSLSVLNSSPNSDTSSLMTNFQIDTTTGQVQCFSIDHESMYHNITLQVFAVDSGTVPLTATATIHVVVEVSATLSAPLLCRITTTSGKKSQLIDKKSFF